MSRFLSPNYKSLDPYTPGEQPRGQRFVKLNTNESPFSPCAEAVEAARLAAERVELYSDPECYLFRKALAEHYGVELDSVIATNGSDEVLSLAFMAFCSEDSPALFPDITYGFYPVFANFARVPYKIFPLREDFTLDIAPYKETYGVPFIANPNAPTGIILGLDTIEELVCSNPDRVVVIDEAYVDFGGESAIPLTRKYKNLLVTGTFSKSRSMAGARLGFGIGSPELIRDLNTLRCSTNPYNVNSITLAMGRAVLENDEYSRKNCDAIIENREWTKKELEKLGFISTPSMANFIFTRHPDISGERIYSSLREKGVLVRHFNSERIKEYNRITVGSGDEMKILINSLKEILEENK